MSNSTGDKIKAGVNKAKGEVKDQIGNATNNRSLQAEGKKTKPKVLYRIKLPTLKKIITRSF